MLGVSLKLNSIFLRYGVTVDFDWRVSPREANA